MMRVMKLRTESMSQERHRNAHRAFASPRAGTESGNFLRTLKERERKLEDLKAEFESRGGKFQVMTELSS
jgi:hypothetical protein